jgi:hypothetical protein
MVLRKRLPVSGVAGAAYLFGGFFTVVAEGLQRFVMRFIRGNAHRCLFGREQPQAQHHRWNQHDKKNISPAKFHACTPVFTQPAPRIDVLV